MRRPDLALPAFLPAVVLLFPLLSVAALGVPQLQGRVNDYAGLLSQAVSRELEAKLASFEDTDSTQVAVLTIPSLQGEDLEGYSIRVAQAWGLGQKGKDNGVLVLVARDDRRMRIDVGKGLEWRLTDVLAGRIVDRVMAPRFREGRFDQGVIEGVDAVIAAVRGEYQPQEREEEGGESVLAVILLGFLLFSVLRSLPAVARGVGGAVLLPLLGLFMSLGTVLVLALVPLGFIIGLASPLILGRPGSVYRRGRRGGGIFYGGGGWRGGSGGGFSGGGGGFGGGGASGRW